MEVGYDDRGRPERRLVTQAVEWVNVAADLDETTRDDLLPNLEVIVADFLEATTHFQGVSTTARPAEMLSGLFDLRAAVYKAAMVAERLEQVFNTMATVHSAIEDFQKRLTPGEGGGNDSDENEV